MDRSFRSGILLFVGIAIIAGALALRAILIDPGVWTWGVAAVGLAMVAAGTIALRADIGSFLQKRRGEIALYTVGAIGVYCAIAALSLRFPARIDMTEEGMFSLSPQTATMLDRLEKPVKITFFHDPMMRETVELYELMAARTPKVTVEFFDPMINPAQARLMGVQFAGTAVLQSEGRKVQINSPSETDIANGILRVSRAATQTICFLEGHGEPDPFSLESHDHMEGEAGHSHGLGDKLVIHEQHGMAKARNALEAMNYIVEKASLMRSGATLDKCTVLVVAGPKTPLLAPEVATVRAFIEKGGNGLFMFDPFVKTGLEPLMRSLGVVVDDNIVIDDASHFWADPSAPAVTEYNRHQITRDVPLSFFPGARSLSPTEERVPHASAMPLANSSKSSYGETTTDRAEFTEGKDTSGPLTIMAIVTRRPDVQELSAVENDRPKTIDELAAEVQKRKEDAKKEGGKERSRILIVGDSDFATNSFFNVMGNGKLFLNAINFLAAQENLIGVEPRSFDTPRVNLTNRQMKGTFFLSVILIPAILLLAGTIAWWKQR